MTDTLPAKPRIEDEAYKGAGKIGNAWAKFTSVGVPATLIGRLVTGTTSIFARSDKGMTASTLAGTAAFLGVFTAGGIWGWKQSASAQEQHKELQETVKTLRIENAKLHSEKKWAERLEETKGQTATQQR